MQRQEIRQEVKRFSFVLAFALCGCSFISGERVLPDGSKLTVHTHRFFWSSEGIRAITKDKEGFEFTLEAQKSNASVEAIKAVAEGAAAGAVKGAKGL